MRVIERWWAFWSSHGFTHRLARPTGGTAGLMLVLLTAHTSAAQITLAWDPSPADGVDGYLLYYGLQSGTYTTSLDVGAVTTYTITGLSAGQTYYFAITAYDTTMNTESAPSNEVSVTLSPPALPGPGQPLTLEAEAMALTGYVVEASAAASGGALISRLGAMGAPPGVATAIFPGAAGTYAIIVWYFDENDGQSTLALTVNGEVVETWVAQADLPDNLPSAVTLTSRVVATGFPLAPGDVIALEGSAQAGEYARFDKVDFLPDSSAVDIIVDNHDATTAQTGTWQLSHGAHPWDGQALYSATLDATFRWTPVLPVAGPYDVYAWWTYTAVRSTTVPYQIHHQGGTTTVTVNQQNVTLGGRWNLLGTFAFEAGSAGAVTVLGQNGNACADAVRFVKP